VAEDILEVSSSPNSPQSITYISHKPICAGDDNGSILITETIGGTSPYLHSINGSALSQTTDFGDLNAGIYTILTEDAVGCQIESNIELLDGHDLFVNLGDDQMLEEGELANIYAQVSLDSADLSLINWQTAATLDCPNCLHQLDIKLEESTQFFLNVTDKNGCKASDNMTIFVDKNRSIYVPNVFSPNGDGANDRFYIFTKEKQVKINSFMLFDRWGEPVFEQHDGFTNVSLFGWDGKYKNQNINPAVYVWFAELEFPDNTIKLLKGDVLVID